MFSFSASMRVKNLFYHLTLGFFFIWFITGWNRPWIDKFNPKCHNGAEAPISWILSEIYVCMEHLWSWIKDCLGPSIATPLTQKWFEPVAHGESHLLERTLHRIFHTEPFHSLFSLPRLHSADDYCCTVMTRILWHGQTCKLLICCAVATGASVAQTQERQNGAEGWKPIIMKPLNV